MHQSENIKNKLITIIIKQEKYSWRILSFESIDSGVQEEMSVNQMVDATRCTPHDARHTTDNARRTTDINRSCSGELKSLVLMLEMNLDIPVPNMLFIFFAWVQASVFPCVYYGLHLITSELALLFKTLYVICSINKLHLWCVIILACGYVGIIKPIPNAVLNIQRQGELLKILKIYFL